MPTPRSVSCPGDVTAAHLLWVLLVGSQTLRRLVRSCLLYLKTVTNAVVLRSRCSDRCEGEGNVSEGLYHTWAAHILKLRAIAAACAGFHGKLEVSKIYSS